MSIKKTKEENLELIRSWPRRIRDAGFSFHREFAAYCGIHEQVFSTWVREYKHPREKNIKKVEFFLDKALKER